MTDYEHDVFISYCRVGATTDWLKNQFVPMFEEQLHLALGRKPAVFYDQELRTGGTWPIELGAALGKSRTLLALWSKPFLNSDWCVREVSAMQARESQLNLRHAENPGGLIAISIIHNGPPPLKLNNIQSFEINDFYNTRMVEGGALAEGLNQRLKEEADDLATMIMAAPPFQSNWPIETAKQFYTNYYEDNAISQTTSPRFSI